MSFNTAISNLESARSQFEENRKDLEHQRQEDFMVRLRLHSGLSELTAGLIELAKELRNQQYFSD